MILRGGGGDPDKRRQSDAFAFLSSAARVNATANTYYIIFVTRGRQYAF